ncbi:type II secretion system F family protein [Patescibacteria group bacterium]|nr:type II secretion system F family protein [Patescibacteria group bacterium]
MVRVGEKSGDLPHVLSSLAQEYAYLIDIKNKYVSALMYPIVLIIISVVAVLSLFLLVLPNIFVIADQFQMSDLPFITQMLKNISDFLFAYWKQSLIGSAVL